ncbi:MAG: hypothetical protein U1E83_11090 [Methylotetracoccus sp.]
MLIAGGCHCGAIRYQLLWQPEPDFMPARACSCTFCVKHAAAWTSCPSGELCVTVPKWSSISRYSFATKTAEFLVCVRCGVVPLVTSTIDEVVYAVVNVNTMDGIDKDLLRRDTCSFSGEGAAERLERRRHNWIGRVRFVDG